MPRMDDYIISSGKAIAFSTLDTNSGYRQVKIDEKHRDIKSSTSRHGLNQFNRMSFGLRNALGAFQCTMNVILSSVKWHFAIVYVEDIAIFSKAPELNRDHVRKGLIFLRNPAVTLDLWECWFLKETIDYSGRAILPRRLGIASHTTDPIRCLRAPTNLTNLRSFLGLCNFFRTFVPSFIRLASLLNKKLREDQPKAFGSLNNKETQSTNVLKKELVSPPVLALPNSTGYICLDTDVSIVQVGFVLLRQQEDGIIKAIGYWQMSLIDAERKYDTKQWECLAIVCMGCTVTTSMSERNLIHPKNRSRFTHVDPESYRK